MGNRPTGGPVKETIRKFNNIRLEQEIANIYVTAHRDNPGKPALESEGSHLAMLWDEFEDRLDRGKISADTDWEPKVWKEGYFE